MRRYTTRFIEIIVINVEKKKGKKSKEGHIYIYINSKDEEIRGSLLLARANFSERVEKKGEDIVRARA